MMKRYFGLLVGIILLVGLVSFVGSGSDLIGELRVTTEHPFLVGGEWVVASELNIGDELTTVDGKLARITSIERVVDDVEVFNIEDDAGINNYVVGGGVVVHNSNGIFKKPLKEVLAEMELQHTGRTLTERELLYLNLENTWPDYAINIGEVWKNAPRLKAIYDNIPTLRGKQIFEKMITETYVTRFHRWAYLDDFKVLGEKFQGIGGFHDIQHRIIVVKGGDTGLQGALRKNVHEALHSWEIANRFATTDPKKFFTVYFNEDLGVWSRFRPVRCAKIHLAISSMNAPALEELNAYTAESWISPMIIEGRPVTQTSKNILKIYHNIAKISSKDKGYSWGNVFSYSRTPVDSIRDNIEFQPSFDKFYETFRTKP